MSLEALRIKNLRSLTDTGRVPIKPITVLVGRNSSGKSTFLRAFPLLRQSVETATESPILWFHPRYVDFGSIQEAVNDRASDRAVTFEFSVRLPKYVDRQQKMVVDIEMTLDANRSTQSNVLRSYEVRAEGHMARLTFSAEGRVEAFTVNGRDVLEERSLALANPAFLIPSLAKGAAGKVSYQPALYGAERYLRTIMADDTGMLEPLVRTLGPLFTTGVKHGIRILASALSLASRDEIFEMLRDLAGDAFLGISAEDPTFLESVDRSVAKNLPLVLDELDRRTADFMASATYLAPLRATAERSYRMQELSVGEVDPRGENLAMFLRSLSPDEASSFALFTRSYLGFETTVRVERLQAEILIKEPGAERHINLVDVGSGYSQVLPLTAILWSTCVRAPVQGTRPTSLLAVEQPELHLHPAHQAKLARMFAGALVESRKAGREVRLLVETHSEALINGLGELIHDGKIAASDVQIVLFDLDETTRQTSVRLAGYDDDGALRDWPFGFFAPVADE